VVKELKLKKDVTKPLKILFQDEMRYGLMSNYRRSWSKVGQRTVVENQQEYDNSYLYSAIDPINGDSFHLIGVNSVSSISTKFFLEKLKEHYKDYHLIIIWDNAPFHKKKELSEIKDITTLFLPSYSPQLNPVERFYGEIRKSTANRIFDDLEKQEYVIEQEVVKWMNNTTKMKQLCGYDWIIQQLDS
jgi:transposase